MLDSIRNLLIKILRIPPPPELPAGSVESAKVFRAARSFYKYAIFKFCTAQISALIGIIVGFWWFSFGEEGELVHTIFYWLEIVSLCVWAIQLPFLFLLVKLNYEFRWYIVTDRSLRIREGVRRVREMTMTFANIQNIYVDQGPVQRMLKIANVRVQTAGGGGVIDDNSGQGEHESMHVGYFRGVDNAEEIKNLIMSRLRKFQDAGLGDPDDAKSASAESDETAEQPSAPILVAAENLLEEARSLAMAVGNANAL